MKAGAPSVWLCSFSVVAMVGATGCSHKAPPAAEQPASAVAAGDRPAAKPAAPSTGLEAADRVTTRGPASIFFDFDSALLRDDARGVLGTLATGLKDDGRPSSSSAAPRLEIDGNCDELGTVEYNLALGQQRAEAAKKYLVQMGVDPGRIHTASYGSQRPRYPGHDEMAHAKNRRDDLVYR